MREYVLVFYNTPYLEDFVKKLYPLCVKEPEAVFLKEFDFCGLAADFLQKRNSKEGTLFLCKDAAEGFGFPDLLKRVWEQNGKEGWT
jgi:hypothetical protein